MTIDFEPGADACAVREALTALCRKHVHEDALKVDRLEFPDALWQALAEFQLFAIATPEGWGGAAELLAADEVVGAFLAPEERTDLVEGRRVAVIAPTAFLPWPQKADVIVGTNGRAAWHLMAAHVAEPVSTLAGEPWAAAELRAGDPLGPVERANMMHDVFLAGYLVERRQFGKPLASFQGLPHLPHGRLPPRAGPGPGARS